MTPSWLLGASDGGRSFVVHIYTVALKVAPREHSFANILPLCKRSLPCRPFLNNLLQMFSPLSPFVNVLLWMFSCERSLSCECSLACRPLRTFFLANVLSPVALRKHFLVNVILQTLPPLSPFVNVEDDLAGSSGDFLAPCSDSAISPNDQRTFVCSTKIQLDMMEKAISQLKLQVPQQKEMVDDCKKQVELALHSISGKRMFAKGDKGRKSHERGRWLTWGWISHEAGTSQLKPEPGTQLLDESQESCRWQEIGHVLVGRTRGKTAEHQTGLSGVKLLKVSVSTFDGKVF